MRKLNNKGFAITGILYTLFILFLLISLSILGGLQARKQILESSTVANEKSYKGSAEKSTEYVEYISNNHIAPVAGKYEFTYTYDTDTSTDTSVKCYSYLNKGDSITAGSVVFTPKDCNDYQYTFSANSMNLVKVYSFEEE